MVPGKQEVGSTTIYRMPICTIWPSRQGKERKRKELKCLVRTSHCMHEIIGLLPNLFACQSEVNTTEPRLQEVSAPKELGMSYGCSDQSIAETKTGSP